MRRNREPKYARKIHILDQNWLYAYGVIRCKKMITWRGKNANAMDIIFLHIKHFSLTIQILQLNCFKYSPTFSTLDVGTFFGLEFLNASYYVVWISCIGCKHKFQKIITMLHDNIGAGQGHILCNNHTTILIEKIGSCFPLLFNSPKFVLNKRAFPIYYLIK